MSTITYNSSCQDILETVANLDTLTGKSKGDTSKRLFTYSTNGTLHDVVSQFVDGSTGNWVNWFRVTYGYLNNTDSPSTEVSAFWKNGQWQTTDSTIDTYDNTGHKVTTVGWNWVAAAGVFEQSTQSAFSYNSSGKIIQWLINTKVQAAGITFIQDQRETWSYGMNGLQSAVLFEVSISSPDTWIKAGQDTYTYDANGLLTELDFQTSDPAGGVWLNNLKTVFSYSNSCK
jgi:hypothetical protein